MKKLNAKELVVLKAIVAAAKGNGYAFALTCDIKVPGLTANQIAGYLTDLHNKKYTVTWGEVVTNRTDRYVQVTIEPDGFEAVGMDRETGQ